MEGDRQTLRGQVVAQADRFFEEALKLNEKHGNRWMRDLLFTGLADDPKVVVPLAEVLLDGLTKAREGTAVPDAQVTAAIAAACDEYGDDDFEDYDDGASRSLA